MLHMSVSLVLVFWSKIKKKKNNQINMDFSPATGRKSLSSIVILLTKDNSLMCKLTDFIQQQKQQETTPVEEFRIVACNFSGKFRALIRLGSMSAAETEE